MMKKQLDQVDATKRIVKKPKNNVLAEEIDLNIDSDN